MKIYRDKLGTYRTNLAAAGGVPAAGLSWMSLTVLTVYLAGWCTVTGRTVGMEEVRTVGREAVGMTGPMWPLPLIMWVPWGVCTMV